MVRRRHRPTREDLETWQRATRDVRPLKPLPPREPDPAPPPSAEPAAKGPAPPPSPPLAWRAPAVRPTPPPPLPPLAADGPGAGMDRRMLRRVRRGLVSIEARLDLHGMTQDAAHAALAGFVRRCQADRKRVVLVITGTGHRREGGGVLRSQLPRWLNEPELRRRVIHMQTAGRGHGGGGAFYLFLRRPEEG